MLKNIPKSFKNAITIKILHEEHVRKRNAGVLTYRGEAKARLEQKLQNQNNKGSRRYDKQSSFSW